MNKHSKPLLITFAMIACFLTSCNAKGNKSEEMSSSTTPNDPAPVATVQPVADDLNWKNEPGMYVEFVTSKGTIVCRLEYKKSSFNRGQLCRPGRRQNQKQCKSAWHSVL